MRFRPFILLSSLARIPGMLGSILMGSFISSDNFTVAIVIGVAALLILLISIKFRDKIIK